MLFCAQCDQYFTYFEKRIVIFNPHNNVIRDNKNFKHLWCAIHCANVFLCYIFVNSNDNKNFEIQSSDFIVKLDLFYGYFSVISRKSEKQKEKRI